MRLPIRFQILLPTSIVMVAVVLGSFTVSLWIAQRSAKTRIQQRIDDVTQILEQTTFPLTDPVLQQMSGLTGADFVLVDEAGGVTGTSDASLTPPSALNVDQPETSELDEVSIADGRYFHRVLPLSNTRHPTSLRLHAFFPADEYRRIWQRALVPTLVAAGTALVAAIGCAYWVGGSVSKSTQGIVNQLRSISGGNFAPSKLPRRDDELLDIATEINRTAEMLHQYESDIRDGERMKTMVAMGAGIAHQIRNSATGCRMALDIFEDENEPSDDEAIAVARRQLSLMENYLQRFLLLAKVEPHHVEWATTDLRDTVGQAIALVRHSAKHLGVDVAWKPNGKPQPLHGDQVAIEQAIVNLLLNAIEAASSSVADASSSGDSLTAQVRIEVQNSAGEMVEIVVGDNGVGPKTNEDVFAPFISEKKSGVGLGLAVVREVAKEHGGNATWQRKDGWTEFVMTLPLTTEAVT